MLMTFEEIKNKVYDVLASVGVFIAEEVVEADHDLSDYFDDSLQFITFIVGLEQAFDIELPDDMIVLEAVSSLNNLCKKIADILN